MIQMLSNARRRTFLVLALGLLAVSASSAQQVTLSFAPVPGRHVDMYMETEAVQELTASGDDELIERNRRRGLTNPIHIATQARQHMRVTAGEASSDGSFTIDLRYLDVESKWTDRFGRALPMKHPSATMVGKTVRMESDRDGRMRVIGIEGETDPEQARVISQALTSVFSGVNELEGVVLEVGSEKQQTLSMDVPIPDHAPAKVHMTTTYRLQDVTGGVARVAYDVKYSLSQAPANTKIEMQGGGFGALEYHVDRRLIKSMASATTMEMSVVAGPLSVLIKMRSRDEVRSEEHPL